MADAVRAQRSQRGLDAIDARQVRELVDDDEFVVAHELGHYVARDTWLGIVAGSVATSVLIFSAHALARNDEDGVASWSAVGPEVRA